MQNYLPPDWGLINKVTSRINGTAGIHFAVKATTDKDYFDLLKADSQCL